MLTAIRVGNFKAFAEPQRIAVRPLTLIYGANSSGKSSIIHSLLLVRHALDTGELDVHGTVVGGESVDLGGFRQFIHRRDVSRRMEWSADFDVASLSQPLTKLFGPAKCLTVSMVVGISLDDHGRPLPEVLPQIHTYEVVCDNKSLMRMSKRRDGIQLDFVDAQHPLLRNVIDRRFSHLHQRPQYYALLSGVVERAISGLHVIKGKLLPEKLIFRSTDTQDVDSFTPQDSMDFARLRGTPEFSAFQDFVRSFFPENLDRAIQNNLEFAVRGYFDVLSELISGVAKSVEEELTRLQYLGPLRSYPPRHLAFSQTHDPNWFAGGGYTWDVIRRDAQVRKQVNAWLTARDRLQTPYELVVRELVGVDQLEGPLLEGIERMNEEGLEVEFDGDEDGYVSSLPFIKDVELEAAKLRDHIRSSDIDKLNELIMIDKRSNTVVSHRDVGIGVSQILPVLVGAYASRSQIVAIEQPEIHLHPALQADLGDVFIQSALGEGKNRFLIESHSEHLLLRIMRRMRETSNGDQPDDMPQVTPKDVCVLFVEPDGTHSIIREMPLNERGELVKAWPGGFFEEGLREIF